MKGNLLAREMVAINVKCFNHATFLVVFQGYIWVIQACNPSNLTVLLAWLYNMIS